ncbi:MAG: phosphate/phosphite/phosphonate ABC transporter substrate-binding protein [Elusimicrobia bacterium]|nr:phosphate/phosphite/phosphonate ABC transporter substrate-binding protein [Elusimicrobiota bacterium]
MPRPWSLLLILGLAGCGKDEAIPTVILSDKAVVEKPALPRGEELRFSAPARLSPKKAYSEYQALFSHVARSLGKRGHTVTRETYAESLSLLEHREIDVAYLCAASYVIGKSKFGAEILAVPVVKGRAADASCLIVHKESPVMRWEDLKGRSFAFTDPDSNAGWLVPVDLLASKGVSPQVFFSKTIYTRAHDNSVKAVASGLVDAAAIHCNVLDEVLEEAPSAASRVRVVWKSAHFAMPPIAVHPGLDPALKARLREAFLALHRAPEGARLLRKAGIERFTVIDDSAYEPIRRMRAAVDRR